MSVVLEVVMRSADTSKKTVKIKNPKSSLTLTEIQTATSPLIAAHMVYSSSNESLINAFDSARYVETTITDIVS